MHLLQTLMLQKSASVPVLMALCELQICKFFVAPLDSLVYGGSPFVFLMIMIHCNGAATRGLNWCRLLTVTIVFICIHFLDSSIDLFILKTFLLLDF